MKETKVLVTKFNEINKFIEELENFGLRKGTDFAIMEGDSDYTPDDPRTIPPHVRLYPQLLDIFPGNEVKINHYVVDNYICQTI